MLAERPAPAQALLGLLYQGEPVYMTASLRNRKASDGTPGGRAGVPQHFTIPSVGDIPLTLKEKIDA